MRLATINRGSHAIPAIKREAGFAPLEVKPDQTLVDLIAAGSDALAAALPGPNAPVLSDVRLLPPLQPGKIVAIGLNYLDHVREAQVDPPRMPLVFAKFPSSVIGPADPVVINQEQTQRVDWEVELAVVIGRRMKSVDRDQAMMGVFGYTVANDVSARDVQFSDGQWVRGKSFDTFCPLGPWIVTADEIPDPQALTLKTRVNAELVQDSRTSEMIFGVAELISFCSQSFTLEPGDLLLTGTPWGCGEFMEPRRSLSTGDVMTVEVEGIGAITNPVLAASEPEQGLTTEPCSR